MGLSRWDGKRPDDATQLPWTRGKPLAWDITIPDTFANSYIGDTLTRATAAADKPAANKTAKYTDLAKTHHFMPIAVEAGGAWNELALEFITELGRRIARITHVRRNSCFSDCLFLCREGMRSHSGTRLVARIHFYTTGALFLRATN